MSSMLTRRPSQRKNGQPISGWRRGAQFIEFAFILPLFLFLVLFVVDAGRMLLLRAELQDYLFSAARSSAQVGYTTGLNGKGTYAYDNFVSNVGEAPLMSTGNIASFDDQYQGGALLCSNAKPYVKLHATYSANLITPGLGSLLNLANSGSSWSLSASAVARCENAVGP